MSAWSHLPNAKHIDRVRASVAANPDLWDSSWNISLTAAWIPLWDDAWYSARDIIRHQDATLGKIYDRAKCDMTECKHDTGWDAIMALLAWPECSYLLDEKPEHVKMLAELGVSAAVLLLPACLALSRQKA